MLPRSALLYAVLALAGVGVILLVLLVHPLATALMVVAVAMVILFLYGEMWVLGIRLNDVSVVNMVIFLMILWVPLFEAV